MYAMTHVFNFPGDDAYGSQLQQESVLAVSRRDGADANLRFHQLTGPNESGFDHVVLRTRSQLVSASLVYDTGTYCPRSLARLS